MSERLAALSIEALFERASSREPTPGGGAVTALTGLLGIALVLKALRISLKSDEAREAHRAADEALSRLASAFSDDADADSAAFLAFIAALKLPRSGEDEKAERRARLGEAALGAARAALATADHAAAALEIVERIRPSIAMTIEADIIAGEALIRVAIRTAIENVEANLGSIADESARATLQERLDALAALRG